VELTSVDLLRAAGTAWQVWGHGVSLDEWRVPHGAGTAKWAGGAWGKRLLMVTLPENGAKPSTYRGGPRRWDPRWLRLA